MPIVDLAQWEEFRNNFPDAHILQFGAWGELKRHFGWIVYRILHGDSGAQLLLRKLPLGKSIAYIPKGPLGRNWNDLLKEVEEICRQNHVVFLKVEPDIWETFENNLEIMNIAGWKPSASLQPRRTILVDLSGDEEMWLSRMKQKTRYNIRLAEKKNVIVKQSEDLNEFSKLMDLTGKRDGFGVHSQEYYHTVFSLFHEQGHCVLLKASFMEQTLGALMVFSNGQRAWYLYGATSDLERNRMPAYLLQWEAMRWASTMGCQEYDLWGVPDFEEFQLEEQFESRSDGLWGVYRFKRGFGGKVMRSVGGFDRIFDPLMYHAFKLLRRETHLGG